MKVINDLLDYDGLKIVQDDNFFNFSLDSVLLPNFVNVKTRTKKILDLGTGNAPIPLIFSCLYKDVDIYGVEIQKKIYDLAKESIEMNNLQDRITLINDDMKNLDNYFDINSFDVIVSNPPYFKMNEGSNLNECEEKTIARHEKTITLDEIVKIAARFLKNGGTFGMVHRTDRLIEIIETFKKYNIEPKRIRLVYPKENEESNMVLIEGLKDGKTGLKILPPLIAHYSNGDYTEEVKNMFKIEGIK
jgi:tRNA1(Val) A37 N6-methylase TrmN6